MGNRTPDFKSQKTKGPTHSQKGKGWAFCFAILFLMGCSVGHPPLPQAPPFNSPAELLQILTHRNTRLRDQKIKTQVNLKIHGVSERRATALLQYRTPEDIKIDIGTLGISVLSAHATHDSLRVFLPRDNTVLSGQPAKVLEAITGVNLAYYDLYPAIFGLPNLSQNDLPYVTRFVTGESVLLEIKYPFWTRRLWLDRRTATLIEEQISSPEGQRISRRLLSNYKEENGFIFPNHIEIQQGEDLIEINVQWRRINTGLTDETFRLIIPNDATRHEIK